MQHLRRAALAACPMRRFYSATHGEHEEHATHHQFGQGHHHEHHGLGDGIHPSTVLTPDNLVRLPNNEVFSIDSHYNPHLHTSILTNGTRVATKDNGGNISRVTFLFKDGPVFESLFTAGVSQHMKFLLNKDAVGSSEFVTKTLLQKAGITIEAPELVNKSWLAYSLEGTRDAVCQASALDKFWQNLLFPRFSDAAMKESKRLVDLEISETKRDSPKAWVMDLIHKTAFKGSPLGHSSFCPGYNTKFMSSNLMFDHWEQQFGFKNVAVIATNVDHHDFVGELQESAWLARSHQKEGGSDVPSSKYVGGEAFELHRRSSDYDDQFANVSDTFSGYAFQAPGWQNEKLWAASQLIFCAMQQATSQLLRNSNYESAVEVFYKPYDSVGLLGLITPNATLAQLSCFKSTLAAFASLSESDLESQKNAALVRLLSLTDSWKDTQSFLVDSFSASGFPIDATEAANLISKVTSADVKEVVESMLSARETLVHYGDSPKAPTLSEL